MTTSHDRAGKSYLTTLYQRSASFRAYLRELAGENSGTDTSLRAAIELFIEYTDKLDQQASAVIVDETDKISVLRPLLGHLRKIERIADQVFSRGHALALPRSLRAATRRELAELGIEKHNTVLVIGEPQNFETFIDDLRKSMFDPRIFDLVELESTTDVLGMVCLPYLEGTRALWQPVTMGHELGHLAESVKQITEHLSPADWLTQGIIDTLDLDRLPYWFDWSLDVLEEAQVVLTRWTREVICDLHAERRFGPAGFAAIAEFLASIVTLETERETHPPGSFRIHCMRRLLADDLGEYELVVQPWSHLGSASLMPMGSELGETLAQTILEHFEEISSAAALMTEKSYDWHGRQSVVGRLRDNFVEYVPALDVGLTASENVTQEDILNAGWLARAHHENHSDRLHRSNALAMLDRVVMKALDDLDFLSLWDEAGAALDESREAQDEPSATKKEIGSHQPVAARKVERSAGTLSSEEITRRLQTSVDLGISRGEALIVTPYVSNAAQGAALDVRLSTKFITFRRSGTPTFDSLERGQDPREMQELVEKDWAGQFILHPLEMVLAATLEYLIMPSDLTAQVMTRSSHGRLGLLSATAVQIHPHFQGCLTLELVNLGQMPLTLTPGERIAQLVFSSVFPPTEPPPQKYAYPTGPQFSRVRHDKDISRLSKMRELRREALGSTGRIRLADPDT